MPREASASQLAPAPLAAPSPRLLRASTILSLLAWVAGINAFGAYFIGQERYIYGWDSALWWRYYQRLGPLMLADPKGAVAEVFRSIRHDDYSLLLVLPLTPFQWLFGSGRVPFILAAVTLYIFLAAIEIALVQCRVRTSAVKDRLPQEFVLAIATFLLLPGAWIPVLLGSPDIAGVVVIGVILLIYISRPLVSQPGTALISIGLLLTLLILVRRWYAYWVVSFFVAAAVADIATKRGSYRDLVRQGVRTMRHLVPIGAVAVLALFLVATPIATRMVVYDYADMYSARRTEGGAWFRLTSTAWSFFQYMGPLTSMLFLAGVANGLARKVTRGFFVFQVVQLVLIVVLFTRVHDIDLHQYSLVIPFVVIAMAGLVNDLAARAKGRLAGTAIVAVYLLVLAAQFALVLSPAAAPYLRAVPFLTAYRHPPQQRDDLTEIRRLVSAIATGLEGNDATVYVVASSRLLNDDLLRNACRQFGHPAGTCNRIAITNHWDKRDGLPSRLFTARYVVLATPVQYHVDPAHQRVIGIPADAILGGRGIGSAFRRLPGEFALDAGVHAVLYERTRQLGEAELQSFERVFLDFYPDRTDLFSLRSRIGQPG